MKQEIFQHYKAEMKAYSIVSILMFVAKRSGLLKKNRTKIGFR